MAPIQQNGRPPRRSRSVHRRAAEAGQLEDRQTTGRLRAEQGPHLDVRTLASSTGTGTRVLFQLCSGAQVTETQEHGAEVGCGNRKGLRDQGGKGGLAPGGGSLHSSPVRGCAWPWLLQL